VLHILTPASREEIEYPVAGGGVYSRPADYVTLLRNLLSHYMSLTTASPPPATKILSDSSVRSLFAGTLPQSAKAGLVKMYNPYLDIVDPAETLGEEDVDWSTAMAIYRPNGGTRRDGWGRYARSVGWGGAAGTEYWMDPEAGIAVSSRILGGQAMLTSLGRFHDANAAGQLQASQGGEEGDREGRVRRSGLAGLNDTPMQVCSGGRLSARRGLPSNPTQVMRL
jgi:hypothetical protein